MIAAATDRLVVTPTRVEAAASDLRRQFGVRVETVPLDLSSLISV
jgi:hypothetical protein